MRRSRKRVLIASAMRKHLYSMVQSSPNLHLLNIWGLFSKFKLEVNLLRPDDDNKNIPPILLFLYCAFPDIILSRVNMKKTLI